MLFPENIEDKIGFTKIRGQLKNHCKSAYGKDYVNKIQFSTDADLIRRLLRQTDQMIGLIKAGENLPPNHDVIPLDHLKRIHVEGVFLETDELYDIGLVLKNIDQWLKFLKHHNKEVPDLIGLASGLISNIGLAEKIFSKIDEKRQIRDNASTELRSIRGSIIQNQVKARKSLEKIIKNAQKSAQSPDDGSLTVRNGRLVIPIKAEFKRSFKGFIHDESSTGRLAYIEPAEVLEINNSIKELQYREKREIIKILTDLTNLLRPEIKTLEKSFRFLAKMEFITAKSRYAIKMECCIPEITKKKMIRWRGAKHPILSESLNLQGKTIIPLDIDINDDQRILVISGPNAGGKSVCLKTVCLLQYMVQTGLPIPVREESTSGVFDRLFIDIGDQQSIESDLSTYSSHLINMVHFVNHANQNTLFLIDEFGSGTDPLFGGAIAESILSKLHLKGSKGLVTTHYHNLKKFAQVKEGVNNGRMRFDVKNLEPLYQLEIGKPGSSFALEIARKIGLAKDLLDHARTMIGVDQIELDQLLNDLELEKKNFEVKNQALDQRNSLLKSVLKNYEELKATLEKDKKRIIGEAKKEALEILQRTNKKTENLIREIKENNAEQKKTRRLREDLKQYGETLKTFPTPIAKKEPVKVIDGTIEMGSFVRIKGQLSIGEVLTVKGKDATVLFGSIKTKVKLNKLERVKEESRSKMESLPGHTDQVSFNINSRKAEFNTEIDLRGKRAEQALMELVSFIDNATMFAIPSARIVHGKGDGILRSVIRNELKSYKSIKSIHDEHADRGGDGVTIVTFK